MKKITSLRKLDSIINRKIFPLYKNDGHAMCLLTELQYQTVQKVKDKIHSGKYILEENNCLCANKESSNDIIISEKDRFGLPIASVLCTKCGLIRSQYVFDEQSNFIFYAEDYRNMYVSQATSLERFFIGQQKRGVGFLKLYNKNVITDSEFGRENVLEIGCGAGGILYPFFKKGYICKGIDYDINYLNYGKNQGLDLRYGNYENIIDNNSVDILILSHVMEHFLNPIIEIQKVIAKIKNGGYLIIEVPGIFAIDKVYGSPLLYLQNAHVYNYYYYYYLKFFFATFGLNVIYGDERCTFILQKPVDWKEKKVQTIYDDGFSKYAENIALYLIKVHKFSGYYKVRYNTKGIIVEILDYLHLKEPIKKILGHT